MLSHLVIYLAVLALAGTLSVNDKGEVWLPVLAHWGQSVLCVRGAWL